MSDHGVENLVVGRIGVIDDVFVHLVTFEVQDVARALAELDQNFLELRFAPSVLCPVLKVGAVSATTWSSTGPPGAQRSEEGTAG